MLKGSGSNCLESEFRRLAESQAANLGKIYGSVLDVLMIKRPKKKEGLKVEKKPSSKELGVKAERKFYRGLGLQVENKGKPKVTERGVNQVGVIPAVASTALAKEFLQPKLLYEYSKDTGKSIILLSSEEAGAVLKLVDKSTKEGDIIENGADLKVSDSNNRVLFETDSKGLVIYSQNQRKPSVLKENGLSSAMDLLRSDISNVISRAAARKPLNKEIEENQSAMPLDEELLAKAEPHAVPVERDEDIPRARIEEEKAKAPDPPVKKSTLVVPLFHRTNAEKIRLLNSPVLGLEPGSSVFTKGGSLSVEHHEGKLVVFFSNGHEPSQQIAALEDGKTTITPQFSDEVHDILRDHISELSHPAERASSAVEAPKINNLEPDEEFGYEH